MYYVNIHVNWLKKYFYKYSIKFFQIVTIWDNIPLATLSNIHLIQVLSKEDNQLKIETKLKENIWEHFLHLKLCVMII